MITEWWQQLIFSLVTISFGALLGYYLSQHGARLERKLRDAERLRNAVQNILSELQTNLEIAKQPFQSPLITFVTSVFIIYAGDITRLPNDIQDAIYRTYVEINMGNAIVQTDLHKIKWGLGYLDNVYKEQRKKIVDEGEKARQLLENWLKENDRRCSSAKRQSP